MAFWRRRFIYTVTSVVIIAAYLSFLNLVQEAVLSANRAVQRSPPSTSLTGHSARHHLLPTVTGYSLEMQFRTARVYKCPTSKKSSEVHPSNGVWQHLTEAGLYLFSAHYDDRMKGESVRYPFIRVLAMSEGPLNATFYCQMWSGREMKVTSATYTEIWIDTWDQTSRERSYRPYLLSCPVIGGQTKRPQFVSVGTDPCNDARNRLEVRGSEETMDAINSMGKRKNFAVCVKGLDFPSDISGRLVEWMEVHRVLGVQHFSLYVYRVHPNVQKVLDFYAKGGPSGQNDNPTVTIVPLTLPGQQPNFPSERTKFLRRNVWQKRRNELVPYNDCYYRHARYFHYVVPLDVDEMIVPLRHDNWTSMVDYLKLTDPILVHKHASLSAQQVYFMDNRQGREEQVRADVQGIPKYTHAMRMTRRSRDFSPPGHGVKSFMSGDNCLTVFNHYALETLAADVRRDVLLPTDLVQLNHYKKECPSSAHKECPLYEKWTQVDTSLWRFKDKVVPKVTKVLKTLQFL